MTESLDIQRIARLTPLAEVLASFDLSIAHVAPREAALVDAVGFTLAADTVISAGHPKIALALRDGYAVRSEQTIDASADAPARLPLVPQWLDAGSPLPDGADAVAPHDTVHLLGEGNKTKAEVLTPVAPGDGVLPANADAAPSMKLQLTGARLRRIDIALLAALGVERVIVREPRIRVAGIGPGSITQGAVAMITGAIGAESGIALTGDMPLEAALGEAGHDAVVAIGGTGDGRNDSSVRTLARIGRVAYHGVAIAPGETTALGFVGIRPVLLLPGRIDAALAGWLTVGRRMLARLAFRLIEEQPFSAELARDISSQLGLAEVVPVRRRLGRVEPLASGYLSIQALARAEGWVLVPADCEGYMAGARVVVRPWP